MKTPALTERWIGGIIALLLGSCASLSLADDPAAPSAPPFEYSRLAHPEVADRIQLTDEQRAEVSQLLAERAQAMVAAGDGNQLSILEKSNQALADVLTPEQREMMPSANSPQKLRFSFRSQQWIDVLDWFAKQAGLSLIMDEAPTGEFTYSDAKEYAPSEAIDLLNSVLLTKGFTLSRRERMLLLIKLGDTIPYDMIEQISPEQIDRFGKFELVTVVFPIGNRPAETVKTEVEPLLGVYGRCVALPSSKQVHVTDTAGKMHAIASLVASVPEPSPPQPPAPAPPAPSPRLEVLPYRQIDGNVAVETLKQLVPQATYAVDKRSRQISVYGLPAQLEAVKAALAQLTADPPPEIAARLEAYAIRSANISQLSSQLRLVAPDAKIEVDLGQNKLLIFGSPEEQEAVQQALVTLDQAAPEETPTVRVYPLKEPQADSLLKTLSTLLPSTLFHTDTNGQRLVALGNENDHQTIQRTLDQWGESKVEKSQASLRIFHVSETGQQRFQNVKSTWLSEFPGMKILDASRPGELVVWADETQHEAMGQLIEALDSDDAKSGNSPGVLVVYRVADVDSQTTVTLLTDLFPSAKITLDPKSERLLVWASLTEHAKIRGIVGQFASDAPASTEKQLIAYDAAGHDVEALMPMLKHLVPEMQISADKSAQKIFAWGAANGHQLLAPAMKQLLSGDRAEQRSLKIYPTGQRNPSKLRSILTQAVPDALLVADAEAHTLAAWANDEDHAALAEAIQQLTESESDGQHAKLYRVDPFPPDAVLDALDSGLRDQVDIKQLGNQLWIRATAAEHERLAVAMDEVKSQLPEELAQSHPVAQVYMLQHVTPDAVRAILSQLLPSATFVVNSTARALAATASEDEHVRIRQLIAELDRDASSGERRVSNVYPVESGNAASIAKAIMTLYSKSSATAAHASDDGRQLAVVAPQRDQDAIQQIVRDLGVLPPADGPAGEVRVYPLNGLDGKSTAEAMQTLFTEQIPPVRLRFIEQGNQLLAVANDGQHAQLQAALDQLRPHPRDIQVYQLSAVDPLTAENAIDELFADLDKSSAPTADIDTENQRLIVRGTADQLAQVRGLLTKLGESGLTAESGPSKFRVVPFQGNAAKVLEQLQRLWPDIRSNELRIVDPAGNSQPRPNDEDATSAPARTNTSLANAPVPPQGVVSAKPVGFQAADDNRPGEIERDDNSGAADGDTPSDADPSDAPVVVIPGANRITITSDDPEALDQFESLLKALSQLDTTSIGAGNYAVFPLKNASAGQLQAVFDLLFQRGARSSESFRGKVIVVADERLNALIVHGSRRDRETVERLVKVLDTADAPNALVMTQPKLIPLQHSDAERIHGILKSVYKSQLTSGGGRKQVAIPKDVPPQVASVLQQINAAAAGPILSLEIDTVTNSIVLMAPQQLGAEVETFIRQLDNESESANRRVTSIIRLNEASSVEMRKILQQLLKSKSQRR